MKKAIMALILITFTLTLLGCGETLTGAAKDIKRMSKGVKTVFFRDSD